MDVHWKERMRDYSDSAMVVPRVVSTYIVVDLRSTKIHIRQVRLNHIIIFLSIPNFNFLSEAKKDFQNGRNRRRYTGLFFGKISGDIIPILLTDLWYDSHMAQIARIVLPGIPHHITLHNSPGACCALGCQVVHARDENHVFCPRNFYH